MARALLVVPPLIKYTSGPLLGPALLQSAAQLNGHECTVVDLNAHYLQPQMPDREKRGPFVGDHDKPCGPVTLQSLETDFVGRYIIPSLRSSSRLLSSSNENELLRQIKFGFLTHRCVQEAALGMAGSSFGSWARRILSCRQQEVPDVVGLSLLHAGQVIPAVAVSMLARNMWPEALILWGGPHVSGLGRKALLEDLRERVFAADVFVTGHAEDTFVAILDQVSKGIAIEIPSVLEGQAQKAIAPSFDDLSLYDGQPTLPAQSSLGCAYGRCAFCTYPSIESMPTRWDLDVSVGSVAELARSLGASLSIKDSLVTPSRLSQIGTCVDNRVVWSASTKLSRRIDSILLSDLHKSGLTTLEVGLESLLEETQRKIDKVQPLGLYETFVADVAKIPDLSIVVNYMVGFPWEDEDEALRMLEEARRVLQTNLGSKRAKIELNEFELERLAPMARFPEAYGIGKIQSWPWASVLEFERQK